MLARTAIRWVAGIQISEVKMIWTGYLSGNSHVGLNQSQADKKKRGMLGKYCTFLAGQADISWWHMGEGKPEQFV